MKRLHALLVGINDYNHNEIKNLFGCVNDVKGVEKLLRSETYKQFEPEITILLNEEATYGAIIQSFQKSLRNKAKPGDIAIFQFSGHGSRQLSATEFHEFYPENYDETLVCYDSRRPGGFDLADKELAVLIKEVADKGAEVIVMLDCCHSGSGTKAVEDPKSELLTRQTSSNTDKRHLDLYINGWYLKKAHPYIPKSKHILLAACDQRELAKESLNHAGIFTENLLEILNEKPQITYAELYEKLRKKIIGFNIDQTPQIEPYEGFNPYAAFISGEKITEQQVLKVFFNSSERKWNINIGALGGISTSPHKPSKFAVYRDIANDENIMGIVETQSVLPHRSYLSMSNLVYDNRKEYFAKLISLPENPLIIRINDSNEMVRLFMENCPDDLNIEFSNDISKSKYEINVTEDEMSLLTNYPKSTLIGKIKGAKQGCAIHLIELLNKINKWERAINISNKNSKIPATGINFELFHPDGNVIKQKNSMYEFLYDGKKINAILKAINNTSSELYFNLMYFSRDFGIYSLTNNIVVPAKSEYVTLWGNREKESFYLPSFKKYTIDTFRLFVSKSKIDSYIFTQDSIEDFGQMRTYATKDISGFIQKDVINPDDWTVKTIEVYMKRT